MKKVGLRWILWRLGLGWNFNLQAISSSGRSGGGGQAMKNLSPQNRDVAEARSGGANWGANFSSFRPSYPDEAYSYNVQKIVNRRITDET
jgi:hypothetical protein